MNTFDKWTTKIRLKGKRLLIFFQLPSDINGDNKKKDNGSEPIPHVPRGKFYNDNNRL